MFDSLKTRPWLLLTVIVTNTLLSLWCLSQDPVINNDGVTYIALAKLIGQGNWAQAIEHYSWPYYPWLLSTAASLLPLGFEKTAHLLNLAFLISLSFAFICVVSELTPDVDLRRRNRIILIATAVILLFPSITKYRSFVIRDFAYLSFYLWSLYFLFKYCVSAQIIHLIAWLILALIGCLFRFESVAFVLMAPLFFALVTQPHNAIRRPLLFGISSILITAAIALFWWYASAKYAATIAYAQSQNQNINGLWDLFFANLSSQSGQAFTLSQFLWQSLSNIGNVLYELMRRMAVLYLILAVMAYFKNLCFETKTQTKVWLAYIGINLVILFCFSFFNNFVVSRYTLATALTLLLLSPFALNWLYERAARPTGFATKAITITLLILLLGISVDRLDIDTDKLPRKQAGLWLANNTPADAKIFSTDKIINHYAGRGIQDTENTLHTFESLLNAYVTKQIKSQDYIAFVADFSDERHRVMWQTFTYHFGLPLQKMEVDKQNSVLIYSHHVSNLKTLDLRY